MLTLASTTSEHVGTYSGTDSNTLSAGSEGSAGAKLAVDPRSATDGGVSAESADNVLVGAAAALSCSADSARAFLTVQKLQCLASPCMFLQGSEQYKQI